MMHSLPQRRHGFSDKYLSQILEVPEDDIRNRRIELGCEEAWEGVHVSGTKTALTTTLLTTLTR